MGFLKNLSLAWIIGIVLFIILIAGYFYYNWKTNQLEASNLELQKDNAVKEERLQQNQETITKTTESNKVTAEKIKETQQETIEILQHNNKVKEKTEEKINAVHKQEALKEKEKADKISEIRINSLWELYCKGDDNSCYEGRK